MKSRTSLILIGSLLNLNDQTALADTLNSSPTLSKNQTPALIEEVLVTATKRPESLQDIPMSVSAFSQQQIDDLGAISILDLAVRVPNLGTAFESDGQFDSNSPSLRGVFGKNTTGFYINNIPVNASLLPRVLDVSRVEVLRGPQGSLYGARSMGGTIRLITPEPDLDETSGSLKASSSQVTDGDFNHRIEGAFNTPLHENKLAIFSSGYMGMNSGIQDRSYQATYQDAEGQTQLNPAPEFERRKNIDNDRFYGGLVAVRWQPNDLLSIEPRWIGQKIEADNLPFADRTADNTEQMRFFDSEESGTDEWHIASLDVNWQSGFGDWTSNTAYYQRDTDESEEVFSFLHALYTSVLQLSIAPIESVIRTQEQYSSITHETRLASPDESPWRWTAGVFLQDLTHDHLYPPSLQVGVNEALNQAAGQDINIIPNDLIFTTDRQTDTQEFGIFGEITFDFNDNWSLTTGGRFYDIEVSDQEISNGFANGGPSNQTFEQAESGFNPKLSVQYQPNKRLNIFSNIAKGMRVGGINGNVSAALCQQELDRFNINLQDHRTFDSDELWSYELGIKHQFSDQPWNIKSSAFYIDWTNIQQLNRLECGFQFSSNAGTARSQGVELELEGKPTDALSLNLAIGYTEAEITDAGGAPRVQDGDRIQGVPDITVSASMVYNFDLPYGWTSHWRLDANHYGKSFSANNETSAESQRLREAWSAVNTRWVVERERYEMSLFVNNLLDERANLADSRSIAAETPGRPRIVTSRPRTIGLEGKLKF